MNCGYHLNLSHVNSGCADSVNSTDDDGVRLCDGDDLLRPPLLPLTHDDDDDGGHHQYYRRPYDSRGTVTLEC